MATTLNRAHKFANGEVVKYPLIKTDNLRERRSNQERYQKTLGPQCHTKFENGEVEISRIRELSYD